MAASTTNNRWQFWSDRGRSFTNIVAKRPDGKLTINNCRRIRNAKTKALLE